VASLQLQIPRSTVQDVLHKRLRLRAYKIQLIHALKPSDQVARTDVAGVMLEITDASPDFLRQVCFSDEATFHVSGTTAGFAAVKIHMSHVNWKEAAPT
jgi:hypothetical protein